MCKERGRQEREMYLQKRRKNLDLSGWEKTLTMEENMFACGNLMGVADTPLAPSHLSRNGFILL